MISRNVRELKKFDQEFVVDIETISSTGKLLAIGVIEFGNEDDVYICNNWDDFLEFVCFRESYKRIRIWAHNGFGFDHLYLMTYLAGFGELDVVNGVFEHGHIQYVEIKIFDRHVCLADSFAVFQMSLRKVSDGYCVHYKKQNIEVLPEQLGWEQMCEYLRLDVLSLREAIQKLISVLKELYPSFGDVLPTTVGSLAIRIFRLNLKQDIVTSPIGLDEFERSGYFGGLVGCTRTGIYKKVWGLDVNSMYPSVMLGRLYPVSYLGYWTRSWESGLGLWLCKVKYPVGYNGIRWLYDVHRKLFYDKSECVIDTETVEYLMANNYSIEIVKGYIYLDVTSTLFSYMEELYRIKEEGGAKKQTVKYILNSTYGKFGQRHERTRLGTLRQLDDLVQLVRLGISVQEYDFGKQQLYTWKERELSTNTFCIIAALVTARARLKLVKAINCLMKQGCQLIYYDTDSLHFIPNDSFNGKIDGISIHPTRLGSWGIQFKNAEAGYAGRKLYYYLEKKDGKGKVAAKGISGFTRGDMVRLIQEGERQGGYQGCTSPREVLFKGVSPGIFSYHERRVKVLLLNENEVK